MGEMTAVMRDIRVSRENTGVEQAIIMRYSPIRREDSCDERYKGK